MSINIIRGRNDDQTSEEIRDSLETLTGANRLSFDAIRDGTTNLIFTVAERNKLAGIEAGATADQTSGEIRDSLGSLTGANRLSFDAIREGITNLIFITAERNKLAGIEAGATTDQTAVEIRNLLETLTLTDRLNFDSVQEGTTNLILTSAERANIAASTGALRVERYAITNVADQDSVFTIPANARILSCWVQVVTPYSAGGTISVGYTAALTAIMTTTLNDPQSAAIYVNDQDTAWDATARVVKTTVAGAPAAGAGFVVVKFTSPNA